MTYFVNESYKLKKDFLNYLRSQIEFGIEDEEVYHHKMKRFLDRHPYLKERLEEYSNWQKLRKLAVSHRIFIYL